jgi:hypothetical protein
MADQRTDDDNSKAGDPNATGRGDAKPVRDVRAGSSVGGTAMWDQPCKDQYKDAGVYPSYLSVIRP